MRDFDPTASEYAGRDWSPKGGRYWDITNIVKSVAGPLIGGIIGSNSADKASDAASASAADTNALNKYIYEDQKALNQPLYQNGLNAQNKLAQLITGGGLNTQFQFDANDLYKDPSYQFRLEQGTKAVQNSAAARGGLNSGAALKALTRYGQDYGSTEYGNAYNRAQSTFNQNLANTLNPLQSLAGQAQTSATALSSAGQNYANQSAATSSGLANSLGAASIAQGNALNAGLTGATNNYNSQNLLQQLLSGGGSGSAPAWTAATNYTTPVDYSLGSSSGTGIKLRS